MIYYGGRGGSDPRIPAKAERIFRPISIAGGHLTGQEAAQLVRYGDPQSAGPEPALLSPAPSFPLLRTLGVLCVGYLAVHVAKRLGPSPPIPSDVEARRLGWAALPDGERQRFSTSLLSYEEEVNSPAWWHDLIVAAAGSLEKLPAQLKRELRQAQARGLVDPTAVERLVAELLKDHEHAPRHKSIEAAFQSLAALEQW